MAATFRWLSGEEGAPGLTLSEPAAARFGLPKRTPIFLRVGSRRIVASLNVDRALPADALLIGPEEAARLGLSSPAVRRFTLRLQATSRDEIRLGPVIGILIGRTREEIRQNRHGFPIFEMLWNVRSLGGIAYYFSLEDIDWQSRSVFGYVYVPDRVPVEIPPRQIPFETADFPFPDAIYRRRFIPYDKLARIQAEMTPLIFNNPRASHKLRQAEALRKVPFLAPFLPEGKEMTGAPVLDGMIARHRAVYVKRSGLGAGRGVFYVTRGPAGGYRLTYRASTKEAEELTKNVASFQDLTSLLAQLTGYPWRSSDWCVQQAISWARWQERPFDVRVVVQKDGRGLWNVNGSYVRVAPGPGSVLCRRGDYISADSFFVMKWGTRGAPLLTEVFTLAHRCAVALDEALGPLGDLGIDVVIDGNDKLWFLEANAGPGYLRVGPDDRGYWQQLSAPIAFASYLAGFPTDGGRAAADGPGKGDARA